jgi:RNAse (barnase) inhibitor barstar
VSSDTYISIPGENCKSKADLFETVNNSLRFSEVFSFNWDSFNDCVFDFIMLAEGNVFVFFSNVDVLLSENNRDRKIFFEIIEGMSQNEYPKKVTFSFSE